MIRRLVRILVRLVGVMALLAAITLALVMFLLPPLAGDQIRQQLAKIGLHEADLTVDTVGLTRSSVSNITLGPDDRIRLDHLTADYDVRDLSTLALTVTGLRLRATVADNHFDLGPLLKLQLGESTGGKTSLPFASIDIRASTLILETPGHTYRFDLEGRITRTALQSLDVDLTLAWLDQRVGMTGSIQLDGDKLNVPDLHVAINPFDLPLPGSPATLRGVGADLHLSLALADQSLTVDLLDSTALKLSTAQFGAHTLSLDPGKLSGQLTLRWGDEAGETLDGVLRVDDAALTYEAAKLRVPSIAVELPIHFGPGRAEPGAMTTSDIHLGDDTLPPLHAEVALNQTTLSLSADWPMLESTPIHISGSVGADGIDLEASTGVVTVIDPHAIGKRFAALSNIELSGGFALTAMMNPDTGYAPHVNLAMYDTTVRSSTYDITADGVSGAILLTGFTPLRTPGSQRLTVNRFATGKLELTNGRVGFRIESDRSVFIEQLAFTLGASGQVEAHAFRYDMDQPKVSTDLYIEDLNLGDWLSVLSNEKIKATGHVYGRLPITFRPDAHWKLSLGKGFLYTTPGPGQMAMPSASIAGDLLDTADPRFRSVPELMAARDRIVSALTDYEYSMFRFNIQPDTNGEGMMLRMETRGKGRLGPNPQEIGALVINIHNFDTLVNKALLSKTRLNVDRALEQFFGGGGR